MLIFLGPALCSFLIATHIPELSNQNAQSSYLWNLWLFRSVSQECIQVVSREKSRQAGNSSVVLYVLSKAESPWFTSWHPSFSRNRKSFSWRPWRAVAN